MVVIGNDTFTILDAPQAPRATVPYSRRAKRSSSGRPSECATVAHPKAIECGGSLKRNILRRWQRRMLDLGSQEGSKKLANCGGRYEERWSRNSAVQESLGASTDRGGTGSRG